MVRNAPKLIDYKSPRKGSMIVVVGKRGAIDAEYPYKTDAERNKIISTLKGLPPKNIPQIDLKPTIVPDNPGPCAIIEMNYNSIMPNIFPLDSIFAEAAYATQFDLLIDPNYDVFNTFDL